MSSANQVGALGAGKRVSHPGPGRAVAGRYRVGRSLGAGGEGETFAAIDETSGAPCAVKILRGANAAVEGRVRGEIERLAGMQHPGVVRALDVGRDDGRLFLVMELVTGSSVLAIAEIADDHERLAAFARAASQITDALAYLHGRGVIHGDVAPANVLLGADGHARLIDVGAAATAAPGAAVGTLGFAAPEALVGEVSASSDLFSLGATLFAAWTGAGPFGNGVDAIARMLSEGAPSAGAARSGLPEPWVRLIDRLLQTDRARRPSSARAVLRDVARLGPDASTDAIDLVAPFPAGDPVAGIFVGRARERAAIKAALDRLSDGASAVAAIGVVGTDGAGRRALIDTTMLDFAIARAVESAPPVTVFRGTLAALGTWLDGGAVRSSTSWAAAATPRLAAFAADDAARAQQRRFAALLAALEARAEMAPICAALDAGIEEAAFAAFVAGAAASGRVLLLVPVREPLDRVAALDIRPDPLALDDIRQLATRAAGDEPPPAAVARVAAAAAGHAGTAALLVRQLVAAMREGHADRFVPASDAALAALLARSFAGLPVPVRRVIADAALGLTDQAGASITSASLLAGASVSVEGDSAAAVDLARAGGWLVGAGGDWRLPSPAHRAIVERALGESDLRAIAERALVVLPDDDARAGACLRALGRIDDAARTLVAAARRERANPAGTGARAAAWLEDAARLAPAALDIVDRLYLADQLVLAGRTEAALAALEDPDAHAAAFRAGAQLGVDALAHLHVQVIERRAWILGRRGDLEAARTLLEQALRPRDDPDAGNHDAGNHDAGNHDSANHDSSNHDGANHDGSWQGRALLQARLARVLVSMGRFAEAVAAASRVTRALGERGPFGASRSIAPPAGALAAESALLAHAFAGDLDEARRLHDAIASQALPPARAAYLGALVDQLAGRIEPALAGYRRALGDADASGDIHTSAAIALNRGALAAEAGRYQEALAMQDRAVRELGRLGATAELGTALFNAAMLLIELGDLPGARLAVARLRQEIAARAATPISTVTYLEAELDLRGGDAARALARFADVAASAPVGSPIRFAAARARVEVLLKQQRHAEAAALDSGAVGADDGADDGLGAEGDVGALPVAHGARETSAGVASASALASARSSSREAALRLTHARVVLAAPGFDVDAALVLAPLVESDAAAAARAGRRPLAWRSAAIAARLFVRAARPVLAAPALRAAVDVFEEVRLATPVDHQAGLADDDEARALATLARRDAGDGDASATAVRAARSESRLRRLLRINKRLNSELRLPRLLDLIMDTVIELTEAERGFILLEDDKGVLEVRVARNIDQQTLETGAFELSRSIARQAATGGVPIVTIDAAGDPRFREAVSVSDLHLRSVLAVPLQIKGRAVGTLYVDNRLRKGAFGEADVQLVLDFAEQAAIAIENARLMSEVRRRERQIEVLNRRLSGELAARKEELSGMRQELRENREALAIRYDYRNIVGRSPRMLDLFRLLDRITDTTLPVVIQGESGTGKELVARALHFNGPRRDRAFVSENCAAIPETLLESTLFGAVRGAFTGADHDSRGLFEIADGGTLFLDEVGEMSPGMQGKLLRVLQAGELRRVGSERTRKVDVRIVAATNQDLGRMVEEGRFRQDLFFRLSVARVTLPPLRDRRDDIPAIVEHVLKKSTPGPAEAKRIDPAALARLVAYRWPGNVRELENEILRASALCTNQVIKVADLSPNVAGEAEAALTTLEDPDSLSIKPRVERLERSLLREAMSRSGGNQTRAAEALGLSRFGLQKKLRRYRMV